MASSNENGTEQPGDTEETGMSQAARGLQKAGSESSCQCDASFQDDVAWPVHRAERRDRAARRAPNNQESAGQPGAIFYARKSFEGANVG